MNHNSLIIFEGIYMKQYWSFYVGLICLENGITKITKKQTIKKTFAGLEKYCHNRRLPPLLDCMPLSTDADHEYKK